MKRAGSITLVTVFLLCVVFVPMGATVQAPLVGSYAIIAYQPDDYWLDPAARSVRQLLLDLGYLDDRIALAGTRAELEAAFSEAAAVPLAKLIVVVAAHGSSDGYVVMGIEAFSYLEMADWLDAVEADVVVGLFQNCYGGRWLGPLLRPNRVLGAGSDLGSQTNGALFLEGIVAAHYADADHVPSVFAAFDYSRMANDMWPGSPVWLGLDPVYANWSIGMWNHPTLVEGLWGLAAATDLAWVERDAPPAWWRVWLPAFYSAEMAHE